MGHLALLVVDLFRDCLICVFMVHCSRRVQVVSTCDRMVATGNSYTEACRSFSVSIRELSTHFKELEVVSVSWEEREGMSQSMLHV